MKILPVIYLALHSLSGSKADIGVMHSGSGCSEGQASTSVSDWQASTEFSNFSTEDVDRKECVVNYALDFWGTCLTEVNLENLVFSSLSSGAEGNLAFDILLNDVWLSESSNLTFSGQVKPYNQTSLKTIKFIPHQLCDGNITLQVRTTLDAPANESSFLSLLEQNLHITASDLVVPDHYRAGAIILPLTNKGTGCPLPEDIRFNSDGREVSIYYQKFFNDPGQQKECRVMVPLDLAIDGKKGCLLKLKRTARVSSDIERYSSYFTFNNQPIRWDNITNFGNGTYEYARPSSFICGERIVLELITIARGGAIQKQTINPTDIKLFVAPYSSAEAKKPFLLILLIPFLAH